MTPYTQEVEGALNHADAEMIEGIICADDCHHMEMRALAAYARSSNAARVEAEARVKVAEDDLRYIAEQCEDVARVQIVERAEARTWTVVGRLAREAAAKLRRPQ